MIRVHFIDGQMVDVQADSWLVNGPVVEVGNAVLPVSGVRFWEVVPAPQLIADPPL